MGTPDTQGGLHDALYDWCGLIIRQYVKAYFSPYKVKILDVGAGWGKYAHLLPNFYMDACEVWQDYIEKESIDQLYNHVFKCDILDMPISPGDYDVVIFGDVLEHIETEEAQKLISDLSKKVKQIVVAVPYLYKQEAVDGNPYEAHKQPDLTPAIMKKRYPELRPIAVSKEKGVYVKR
jgi:2-polyprenyl-3-methyl-5-hydroxy-6-metoxy-1,4-benzoquinol methylase